MKIIFVFKGSKKEGFGHIKRVGLLKDYFNEHNSFLFFKGDESLLDFDSEDYSNYSDSKDLFCKIKKIDPHVVIFDCQNNSKELILKLKENNIFTVLIEDSGEASEYADILWDQNISKSSKKNKYYGFENSLLNPDLFNYQKKIYNEKNKTIFICLGGTDINKNIPFLIKKLRYSFNIKVLPGIHYSEYLKYNGPNVTILDNNKNFYKDASECDIALVSGGIIMFEMLALKIPTLVWPQVEHQYKNANQLKEQGLIEVIKKSENTLKAIHLFAENNKSIQKIVGALSKNNIGKGFEKLKKILEGIYE